MKDDDMEWSLKRLEGSIDVLVEQRDSWREKARAAEAELLSLRAMRDRLNDDDLLEEAVRKVTSGFSNGEEWVGAKAFRAAVRGDP